MKKFLLLIFLFASFSIFAQREKVFLPKPNPPKLVNDYAGMLTPAQKEMLEQKLVAYDDSTSNQIAVVIVKSLEGWSVEDAGLSILRTWGVGGQADKDNGIVLLVSQADKKIRIDVGYGLEGAITDYTSQDIIDNELTPNFKSGNYYRGIDDAIDAIQLAAAGRYTAPEGYGDRGDGLGGGLKILFLIIVVIIVLSIISKGGGRNGGMMSRRGYHPWWGPVIGTGGGWSGGGGGGGWSGGGGGFGGFGGGGGGGGGASGGW